MIGPMSGNIYLSIELSMTSGPD